MQIAEPLIAATSGFESIKIHRCIETPNRYLLLVTWNNIEDHNIGFRQSDRYPEWRKPLHHFYDPVPLVEHYRARCFAPTGQQHISPGQSVASPWDNETGTTIHPRKGETGTLRVGLIQGCFALSWLGPLWFAKPRAALRDFAAPLCPGLVCSGPCGAKFLERHLGDVN